MSVHIEAKVGEIAETVLLPGDPLRAKWIAENFLEDVKQYNNIRGMLGFTGTYKGKKVSVQGSGMGMPSIGIYAHELINIYGVKKLIRVGSAGSYQPEVKLRDIVLAMSASTNSNINNATFQGETFAPTASFELLTKAHQYAVENNIEVKAGNILSSDVFYQENPTYYKKWADYGVLCVEMEAAALYSLAAKFGVDALAILTISDSLVTREATSARDRESSFNEMIEIALSLA
ncbi:purine-nucleoside phosphorylase [Pustulibacterium marinum]|uniref:Uridine phosphorylase n=1 Tax=Pustulibacterium marinum TaxID=1224947 RepID=A0A1I7ILF4_9FLAO|nr:purine-nucleoside phosphorylase [Pustulibacterium marinum]SFU73738.1 purine-nucleoside phosphorylase [Pustulibacterium marinum]